MERRDFVKLGAGSIAGLAASKALSPLFGTLAAPARPTIASAVLESVGADMATVMEKSPHVLMFGDGAETFAKSGWPEAGSISSAPLERPNIFRLYEENIGVLTPLIADALNLGLQRPRIEHHAVSYQ